MGCRTGPCWNQTAGSGDCQSCCGRGRYVHQLIQGLGRSFRESCGRSCRWCVRLCQSCVQAADPTTRLQVRCASVRFEADTHMLTRFTCLSFMCCCPSADSPCVRHTGSGWCVPAAAVKPDADGWIHSRTQPCTGSAQAAHTGGVVSWVVGLHRRREGWGMVGWSLRGCGDRQAAASVNACVCVS